MSKSAAYTVKEKNLLAKLVQENSVIEIKKTDAATVREKNEAWQIISDVYNYHPDTNCPRSAAQLRKLWNNLKQRKRKKSTQVRHNSLLTDEGTPEKPIQDPLLGFVENTAPSIDQTFTCPWDSSAVFDKESDNSNQSDLELAGPSGIKCEPLSSISIDTCTDDVNKTNKRKVETNFLTEENAGAQKIAEAVVQQRELHDLRMKITEDEREYSRKKFKIELKKLADEAELAKLKLAEFKRKMNNENE